MKRRLALILAAMLTLSTMATLASCSGEENTTTTGSGEGTGTGTTPSQTVGSSPSTPATTGGLDIPKDLILVAPDSEFTYKVFSCPYSASGPNGTYKDGEDKLAEYMSNYGWNLGDETLPEAALDDIKTWTDKANGPFGDAGTAAQYDYTNQNIGWTGDNHGLILYTTFTVDNLAELKSKYADLFMYFHFDNTPSVYINGKLFFYYNTELTGDPGDWRDTFDTVYPEDIPRAVFYDGLYDDSFGLLKEGENTLVIVMKDAWGGRECLFQLGASPEQIYFEEE